MDFLNGPGSKADQINADFFPPPLLLHGSQGAVTVLTDPVTVWNSSSNKKLALHECKWYVKYIKYQVL